MSESNDCQICGTSKSKYSCPQCHIGYCSVTCYQSESHLQCSENFYEQWIHGELKNCHSNSQAKKKMLEILMRNQKTNSEESLDSDDDEAVIDLAIRMKNVDLDNEEAVWEKLTGEEKKEFRRLVATGNIVKILPKWEPWWKTKKRKTLIQDCSESFDSKSVCPNVPSDIPSLMKLTKTKPSPNIPFMLFNVLASYAFTVRWFKGAHKDMAVEGISTCIALSATLRANKIFTNSVEAFMDFESDFSECEWLRDEIYNQSLIEEDLSDIIRGSDADDLFYCIKASICDLNLLCLQAMFILKQNRTNNLKRFSGAPPSVKLLQQISKKMTYYLSWVVDYGSLLSKILYK